MYWAKIIYRCLSVIVACNYFAFRVELFEQEYENNHPVYPTTIAIVNPSLNWETFDKDNAPKAYRINLETSLTLICKATDRLQPQAPFIFTSEPIRDKSPPSYIF